MRGSGDVVRTLGVACRVRCRGLWPGRFRAGGAALRDESRPDLPELTR